MTESEAIADFWAEFLSANSSTDLPPDMTYYESFTFGSRPETATRLAQLVLNGVKTATSGAMRDYEESGRRPPQPGDFSIVLDGSGAPVCIIETLEAKPIPFNQVDASFAYDYGEGARTLAWWLENLWESYVEEGEEKGWTPYPGMPLLCERFRVVYPPSIHAETPDEA